MSNESVLTRTHFAWLGLGLSLLVLTACAPQTPAPVIVPETTEPVNPQPQPPVPQPAPTQAQVPAQSLAMSDLPGWQSSDAFIAIEAVRASCAYKGGKSQGSDFMALCDDLKLQDFNAADAIKTWLGTHFEAEKYEGQGLLTAYFVPEYTASTTKSEEFNQPVRPRPSDLVIVEGAKMTPPQSGTKVPARKTEDGLVPYYSRADIEAQPVEAKIYMRAEDYFYMQLQGSAFLTLEDGTRVLASYAGDNGLPFVGIAKPMVEKGILTKDQASGDNIRAWLSAHRGPEAQAIMNLNTRYAFFSVETKLHDPTGAAGTALPPGSAVAIDPAFHNFGELIWIDADTGNLSGAVPVYQRLVRALDTGGAIKGNIRADLYMGVGARAGQEAGRVRHNLRFYKIKIKSKKQP